MTTHQHTEDSTPSEDLYTRPRKTLTKNAKNVMFYHLRGSALQGLQWTSCSTIYLRTHKSSEVLVIHREVVGGVVSLVQGWKASRDSEKFFCLPPFSISFLFLPSLSLSLSLSVCLSLSLSLSHTPTHKPPTHPLPRTPHITLFKLILVPASHLFSVTFANSDTLSFFLTEKFRL